MKKIPLCIALFLTVLFTAGAQNAVDMETALRQAADFFYGKIKPEGRKIAVFDLKSDNPEDGETFAERLRGLFSNDGRLVCIERGDMLQLIHGEQAYNLTANVDDSAQIRVGHELGAEVILSGTLLKKEYGFLITINAIDTETAARLGQYESRIELSLAEKMRNYYRENGFLFVGLRAGLGMSAYTPGPNALPNSYSGGKTEINTVKNDFEFALQVSIAPLTFFAIQAELTLVSDSYSVEYTPPMRSRETVREVTYTSLLTPMLGKFMVKPRV
jgi:TolB-like protein